MPPLTRHLSLGRFRPHPMGLPTGLTVSAITRKHSHLGGDAGWLGAATEPEAVCPDGRGRYRHFRNGSIYWTPGTGAHEVHGAIRGRWAAMGWERSALGYPTTDELTLPDGRGRVSHFERGRVYWTPQTGAHDVYGDILGKWAALGAEASYLGYPRTGESDLPNGRGRFNDFEHGQVAWSPAGGAVVSATTYQAPAGGGVRPQGLDPAGVPHVRRKVVCSGSMHLTDHETFGSNEHGDASSPPMEAVVTNESPLEVFPDFVGRAGGEMRVEVKLKALARTSGDVTVTGKIYLYEGTSEETNDLDGWADVNITVPRDQFRSHAVTVNNTDEGDDYAELVFNFGNFPV